MRTEGIQKCHWIFTVDGHSSEWDLELNHDFVRLRQQREEGNRWRCGRKLGTLAKKHCEQMTRRTPFCCLVNMIYGTSSPQFRSLEWIQLDIHLNLWEIILQQKIIQISKKMENVFEDSIDHETLIRCLEIEIFSQCWGITKFVCLSEVTFDSGQRLELSKSVNRTQ